MTHDCMDVSISVITLWIHDDHILYQSTDPTILVSWIDRFSLWNYTPLLRQSAGSDPFRGPADAGLSRASCGDLLDPKGPEPPGMGRSFNVLKMGM